MVLIFDFFETLVHNKSKDFERGFRVFWEKYYREKCSYEEIDRYAEELRKEMLELHRQGREFAFVKDQLPRYAENFGGEPVFLTAEGEADFLMSCNEMEVMPGIREALGKFRKLDIPMYILSNSSFTSKGLSVILHRLGIDRFFEEIWSSAEFGRVKPCRDFFEMGIRRVLQSHPGTERKEILFVGDTYGTDVVGARNVDIGVIWIDRQGKRCPDMPSPDMSGVLVIPDTTELERAIEEHCQHIFSD